MTENDAAKDKEIAKLERQIEHLGELTQSMYNSVQQLAQTVNKEIELYQRRARDLEDGDE